MKVNTDDCRTAEEELAYIDQQLDGIGNFFACDVHENTIKAYYTSFRRLCRKRCDLIGSAEYQYYLLSNYPDADVSWLPEEVQACMDPYKE